MNKISIAVALLASIGSISLLGYTEGTLHVADVRIKPDLKNVTYYKALKVDMSGVTYRWVLLTPKEINELLTILDTPKLDPVTRIDEDFIKKVVKSNPQNKLLIMILNDFKGRKIRRVIKVLKKEKPGFIDKLATILPDVGGY